MKRIKARLKQRMKTEKHPDTIRKHGMDILEDETILESKDYLQHGAISVYDHTINTAFMCLALADLMKLDVDRKQLVRGCLLHDNFQYDWHEKDPERPLHGVHHPRLALENSRKDFNLEPIEENMIESHMFPLGMKVPKYKESLLLWMADKVCAFYETVHPKGRFIDTKERE